MTVIAENPEVILIFESNEPVYRFGFSTNENDQTKIQVFLSKQQYVPAVASEFIALLLGTDYTVVFEADNSGGYISLLNPSSETFKDFKYIIIARNESLEQPQPYPQFYDKEVSENVTDNLERQIQQVSSAVKNVEDIVVGERLVIEQPNDPGRLLAVLDVENLIVKGTDLLQTESDGMIMSSNLTAPSIKLDDVKIAASGEEAITFDLDNSENKLLQIKNRKIIASDASFPSPEGQEDGNAPIIEDNQWVVKLPRDDIPLASLGQEEQVLLIKDNQAIWAANRPDVPPPNEGSPGEVLTVNSTQTAYTFAENSGGGGGKDLEYKVGDKIDTMNTTIFYKEGKFLRLKDSGQKVIPLKGQIIDLNDYPDYKKLLDLDENNVRWIKSESVPNSIVGVDFAAVDLQNGIAVSEKGRYYLTSDGGVTFEEYDIENTFVFSCCAISPDEEVTVIAGVLGKFLISYDKHIFTSYQLNSQLNIRSCCFGESASNLIFVCDHGKIESIVNQDWSHPIQFDSTYDARINYVKYKKADNTAVAVGEGGFILESSGDVNFVSWTVKNPPEAGKQGTYLTPFESIFLKEVVKVAGGIKRQDQILISDDNINTSYSSTTDGINFDTAVDDAVYDFKIASPTTENSFLAAHIVSDKAKIINMPYNSTDKDSIGFEIPVTIDSTFAQLTKDDGKSLISIDKKIVTFNKKLKVSEMDAPNQVVSISEKSDNISITTTRDAPTSLSLGQEIENIFHTEDYVLLETIPLANNKMFCIANKKDSFYDESAVENWPELVKSYYSGEYVFFFVDDNGEIISESMHNTEIYRNKLHNTEISSSVRSSTFFKTAKKDNYIFIYMPIARQKTGIMDFENSHFSMFMVDTDTYNIKHNFDSGSSKGMGFPPRLVSLDILIEKHFNNTYYIGVWATSISAQGSALNFLDGVTMGNFSSLYPETQFKCEWQNGRPAYTYPEKYSNRKNFNGLMSNVKFGTGSLQHTVLKKEEDDEEGIIIGYKAIVGDSYNADKGQEVGFYSFPQRGTYINRTVEPYLKHMYIYGFGKVSDLEFHSNTAQEKEIRLNMGNIPILPSGKKKYNFVTALMMQGFVDIKVVRSSTTKFIVIVLKGVKNALGDSDYSPPYQTPIGGFIWAKWTQEQQDTNTIPQYFNYQPSFDGWPMYSPAANFGHCSNAISGLEVDSGVQMPTSWSAPKGINLIRQNNPNEFYIISNAGAPVGDPQIAYHPQFTDSAPITHEDTAEGRVAALKEYDYSQYTYMTSTNVFDREQPKVYIAKIRFNEAGDSLLTHDNYLAVRKLPYDGRQTMEVASQFFALTTWSPQSTLAAQPSGYAYVSPGQYGASFAYDANFINVPLEMIHVTEEGVICSACEVVPQEVLLKGIVNSPTNHTTIALKKVFSAIHKIPTVESVVQNMASNCNYSNSVDEHLSEYLTASYMSSAGIILRRQNIEQMAKMIPSAPLINTEKTRIEAIDAKFALKGSCKFFDDIVVIFKGAGIVNPLLVKSDGVWQPKIIDYNFDSSVNCVVQFEDHLFISTQDKDIVVVDKNYDVIKIYTKPDTLLNFSPKDIRTSGSGILIANSNIDLSYLDSAGQFHVLDNAVLEGNYIIQTYMKDNMYALTTDHYSAAQAHFYYIWDVNEDMTLQKCTIDFKKYTYDGHEINFANGALSTDKQDLAFTVNYLEKKGDRIHFFATVNGMALLNKAATRGSLSCYVFTFQGSFTQGQELVDIDLGDGYNMIGSVHSSAVAPAWQNPHIFQMDNTIFARSGTFLDVGGYLIGGTYAREDFYLESYGEVDGLESAALSDPDRQYTSIDLEIIKKSDYIFNTPQRNVTSGTLGTVEHYSVDDTLYKGTPGENRKERFNRATMPEHFFHGDMKSPQALPHKIFGVNTFTSAYIEGIIINRNQNYAVNIIDDYSISLVCRSNEHSRHEIGNDYFHEYIIALPRARPKTLDAYYRDNTDPAGQFTQMTPLYSYVKSGTIDNASAEIFHIFLTDFGDILTNQVLATLAGEKPDLKEAYNFMFFRKGIGLFILAKTIDDKYCIYTSLNNNFTNFSITPCEIPEGAEIKNCYLDVSEDELKDPEFIFIQTTKGIFVATLSPGVPNSGLNFVSFFDDYTFVVGDDSTVLRKYEGSYFTLHNAADAPNLNLVDSNKIGDVLVAGEHSYKSTNLGEDFVEHVTVDGEKTYIYSDEGGGKSFLVSDGMLYKSEADWSNYVQASANNRGSIRKSELVFFNNDYIAFFGGSAGVWITSTRESTLKLVAGSYPVDSSFAGFIFSSPEEGTLVNVFVFSDSTDTTMLFSVNSNETADHLATYNFRAFSSISSIKESIFYLGCVGGIRFGDQFSQVISISGGENVTSLILGAADQKHIFAGTEKGSLYFCESATTSGDTFVKETLPAEVTNSDAFVSASSAIGYTELMQYSTVFALDVNAIFAWVLHGAFGTSKLLIRNSAAEYTVKTFEPKKINCVRIQDQPLTVVFVAGSDEGNAFFSYSLDLEVWEVLVPTISLGEIVSFEIANNTIVGVDILGQAFTLNMYLNVDQYTIADSIIHGIENLEFLVAEERNIPLLNWKKTAVSFVGYTEFVQSKDIFYFFGVNRENIESVDAFDNVVSVPSPLPEKEITSIGCKTDTLVGYASGQIVTLNGEERFIEAGRVKYLCEYLGSIFWTNTSGKLFKDGVEAPTAFVNSSIVTGLFSTDSELVVLGDKSDISLIIGTAEIRSVYTDNLNLTLRGACITDENILVVAGNSGTVITVNLGSLIAKKVITNIQNNLRGITNIRNSLFALEENCELLSSTNYFTNYRVESNALSGITSIPLNIYTREDAVYSAANTSALKTILIKGEYS